MSFTKITQDMNIIQSLVDEPTPDGGLTTEQLKAKFDKAGNDLKTAFNNLVDELVSTQAASNIGVNEIYDGDESGTSLQSKLEHLKVLIDNVVLGDIPDNSLTKAKLNSTYSGLLAEKDNTLQTGLNSEKLGGETLAQVLSHMPYSISTYTGDGQESKTILLEYTPKAIIVCKEELVASGAALSIILYAPYVGIAIENNALIYGGSTPKKALEVVENGFKVYKNDYSKFNNNNEKYFYIALK